MGGVTDNPFVGRLDVRVGHGVRNSLVGGLSLKGFSLYFPGQVLFAFVVECVAS